MCDAGVYSREMLIFFLLLTTNSSTITVVEFTH